MAPTHWAAVARLSRWSVGGRLGGRRGDRQGGAQVAARAFCRVERRSDGAFSPSVTATGLIEVAELSRLS